MTKHGNNGNVILSKWCWSNGEPTVKFSGHFMHLVNQGKKSIKQLVLEQRNKSSD